MLDAGLLCLGRDLLVVTHVEPPPADGDLVEDVPRGLLLTTNPLFLAADLLLQTLLHTIKNLPSLLVAPQRSGDDEVKAQRFGSPPG